MAKVILEKGHVFRLHRPENVKKGDWRLVVTCKGCGKPIYLLIDPSKGKEPHPCVGEGKLSVPCPSCYADELYESSDMHPHQAQEDVTFRLPRLKPSGGSRKPLRNRYKKAKPTFGAAWLEDRPFAAAAIGRCVALWTEVEAEMARLLATILKIKTEPALAMFLTLRNSRAQTEVLGAAAKVALSDADYELFGAIMGIAASAEKERNHLVHGRYGGAYEVKEGLLWIDPLALVRHTVSAGVRELTPEAIEAILDQTFVYEPGDIETVNRAIEEAHQLLGFFIGYLLSDNAVWRVTRYPQLCAISRIARELSLLRADQKKNPPQPPQSLRANSEESIKNKQGPIESATLLLTDLLNLWASRASGAPATVESWLGECTFFI